MFDDDKFQQAADAILTFNFMCFPFRSIAGNPDYFHSIQQFELEAQLASRSLDESMLRCFALELEWRKKHPDRARPNRQMQGLCSYDYRANGEVRPLRCERPLRTMLIEN